MLIEKRFNPSKTHSKASEALVKRWEKMSPEDKEQWQSFSKYRESMEIQQKYEIKE